MIFMSYVSLKDSIKIVLVMLICLFLSYIQPLQYFLIQFLIYIVLSFYDTLSHYLNWFDPKSQIVE